MSEDSIFDFSYAFLLAGQRLEECSPGGCYMELCLQMAIIFVGKQFLLSFVEYQLPRLWKLYNSFKVCMLYKLTCLIGYCDLFL